MICTRTKGTTEEGVHIGEKQYKAIQRKRKCRSKDESLHLGNDRR